MSVYLPVINNDFVNIEKKYKKININGILSIHPTTHKS